MQAGVAGKAYDGNNLVELDSHYYDSNASELGLFQDIATKAGQLYRLSFAYSARPNIADNWKGGQDQNAFSCLVRASAKFLTQAMVVVKPIGSTAGRCW